MSTTREAAERAESLLRIEPKIDISRASGETRTAYRAARASIIEAAIRTAVEAAEKPLREALVAAEWGNVDYGSPLPAGGFHRFCPVCDWNKRAGHRPDCILARALATPNAAPTGETAE